MTYNIINYLTVLDDLKTPISFFAISPWEKAATVGGNKTKASIPNLTEGHEYEFRVIAVNKGGPGDPSDPSEVITCKPKFREYDSAIVNLNIRVFVKRQNENSVYHIL